MFINVYIVPSKETVSGSLEKLNTFRLITDLTSSNLKTLTMLFDTKSCHHENVNASSYFCSFECKSPYVTPISTNIPINAKVITNKTRFKSPFYFWSSIFYLTAALSVSDCEVGWEEILPRFVYRSNNSCLKSIFLSFSRLSDS